MTEQKDSYLKTLGQLFNETETLSQKKILDLMDETVHFIQGMKDKLASDDSEVKQQMLEETKEMQRMLESQMQGLAEKTGFSLPELMEEFTKNPMQFAQQEQATSKVGLGKIQKFNDKTEFLINKI